MRKQHLRRRLRVHIGMPVLIAIAMVGVCALPWSDSRAQATLATPPAIDFHIVSAGGKALHSSCFRLSGTLGQTAPGYLSGTSNSLIAGFWSAAPTTGLDEIYFNGFEDC
jgi:hypothetical protein